MAKTRRDRQHDEELAALQQRLNEKDSLIGLLCRSLQQLQGEVDKAVATVGGLQQLNPQQLGPVASQLRLAAAAVQPAIDKVLYSSSQQPQQALAAAVNPAAPGHPGTAAAAVGASTAVPPAAAPAGVPPAPQQQQQQTDNANNAAGQASAGRAAAEPGGPRARKASLKQSEAISHTQSAPAAAATAAKRPPRAAAAAAAAEDFMGVLRGNAAVAAIARVTRTTRSTAAAQKKKQVTPGLLVPPPKSAATTVPAAAEAPSGTRQTAAPAAEAAAQAGSHAVPTARHPAAGAAVPHKKHAPLGAATVVEPAAVAAAALPRRLKYTPKPGRPVAGPGSIVDKERAAAAAAAAVSEAAAQDKPARTGAAEETGTATLQKAPLLGKRCVPEPAAPATAAEAANRDGHLCRIPSCLLSAPFSRAAAQAKPTAAVAQAAAAAAAAAVDTREARDACKRPKTVTWFNHTAEDGRVKFAHHQQAAAAAARAAAEAEAAAAATKDMPQLVKQALGQISTAATAEYKLSVWGSASALETLLSWLQEDPDKNLGQICSHPTAVSGIVALLSSSSKSVATAAVQVLRFMLAGIASNKSNKVAPHVLARSQDAVCKEARLFDQIIMILDPDQPDLAAAAVLLLLQKILSSSSLEGQQRVLNHQRCIAAVSQLLQPSIPAAAAVAADLLEKLCDTRFMSRSTARVALKVADGAIYRMKSLYAVQRFLPETEVSGDLSKACSIVARILTLLGESVPSLQPAAPTVTCLGVDRSWY